MANDLGGGRQGRGLESGNTEGDHPGAEVSGLVAGEGVERGAGVMGPAWLGVARPGRARLGPARQGKARQTFNKGGRRNENSDL